ncbi:tetratricopeptide repeat protein [Streptomyces sp. NBC_00190]|uniref:tetratricopeptide repeat protein n=1 Tax=Streptomyces sp. NBC_00190 TaxID=2903634 RepID=UPI002E2C1676|nr:tetratricopeptide repeat protein [Streptomyces sp. NBC_00190]
MEDESGSADARPGAEVRDSGDARATDGGTAITGVSAATAAGAPGSVSIRATGAAYASHGGVAITGYVAGDVRVTLPSLQSRSVQESVLPGERRPRLFGREEEVSAGLDVLRRADGGGRAAVVVTGAPGIGKSDVALRISRLAAEWYPDGQFHINLALSTGTTDLVSSILHALFPPDPPLPDRRDQQLALLRTTLADKRVLLLVDDTVSEEALLEILSVDGPFALVGTSRVKLSGLSGLVRLIDLGPLPTGPSEELVRSVAGPGRLTGEQTAALSAACAGHPLALHIAAAHLARRPRVNADRYLSEITNPDRSVKALVAGQTALQPVFQQSFDALERDQAQVFSALGVLPHMSFTIDVVAAGIAQPPLDEVDDDNLTDTAALLDSLVELSLIEQIDDDRFVMHEIQHRFARLMSAPWSGTQRADVVRHACLVTAVRVQSSTDAIGFLDEEATLPAESSTEALRSLDADRPGAVALVETARQYEAWDHLVLLAFALTEHLRVASHWKELDRVYQCVQEAGELAGHANWTATALHNRAVVAGHLGESQDAVDLYNRCAETARAANDAEHLFMAQLGLGTLLINLGRPRDAIEYLRSGLHYWRTVGHHQALALALANLGRAYLAVGQTRRAENYLRNSRDLSRSSGFGEMLPTRSIATLLRSTGRVAEAAEESVRDIERARVIGSREWEAQALMDLAAVPASARPESAPAEPLKAALAIHQETGDVQGQVRALFRLGEDAAHRADLDRAATYLAQCAELAIGIGDNQHAARSLTYLASYSGGIGHHDTAESQFKVASDMAQESGSPVLQAEVLQKRAQLLWHRGRIGDAVRLLTEAEQSLAATDESRALAQVRAALGEALVVAGQWQDGARMLRSVVSGFSDAAASPGTRARATRALAVLHSRRGLHTEALSAITRALDDCERHDDVDGVLQCRMALGNIHARAERWAEAADQYEQIQRAAAEHKDLHVLLSARAQAATCMLHTGNRDEAVALMTKNIPLADKLGMDTVLISLHTNLGTCHAKAGDHPAAAASFRTALQISERLDDSPLRATCLSNLARAEKALQASEAARSLARQAFALHQALGNWPEAGETLVFLGALHHETDPDGAVPSLVELVGGGPVDLCVLESLRARALGDGRDDAVVPSPALPRLRTVRISDTVQQALAAFDLESLTLRFATSRQYCTMCNLIIDESGKAELLYLRHPDVHHLMLRLAHSHCHLSDVIELAGPAPDRSPDRFDAECILFGGDRAGIVLDCHGGWGAINGSRRIEDVILRLFLESGFTNLRTLYTNSGGKPLDLRDLPPVPGRDLQASLVDNKITISGPHGDLLPGLPLSFLPRWYERAHHGSLIVIAGRNLPGMVADDPTYLERAILLGQAVGAAVPLAVVRPRRNAPCPCMMRQGRKFKHCCSGREGRAVSAGGG